MLGANLVSSFIALLYPISDDVAINYYDNDPYSDPNNSYNRIGAIQYADQYGTANSNYLVPPDGDDCTNFVSQCIHEGGGLSYINNGDRTSDTSWYYSTFLGVGYYASYAWGGAANFQRHWGTNFYESCQQNAYESIEFYSCTNALANWNYIYSNLYNGDIVQLVKQTGDAHHSMIVDNQSDWNNTYQVSDIDIAEHSNNNIQKSLYEIILDRINHGSTDKLIIERISKET